MTKQRKIQLAVAVVAVAALLVFFRSHDAPYTALVVDAETGKPVEGAIYLAAWWKNSISDSAWFEGGATVMQKIAEGRTGPDGIVNVPGFWRRRIALHPNTLTVYKPGYVLWFQEKVFPTYADREDFGRNRRTVVLQKWDETMSWGGLSNFWITATKGNLSRPVYMGGKRLLLEALYRFEGEHLERQRMTP